jgi:acyl-CoA synthetase (NDP forming)
MVDCPPADQADPKSYYEAIAQFIRAAQGAPARGAVISSLPESSAREIRAECLAAGVVPLQGQREALEALDAAGAIGEVWRSGRRVELRLPTYLHPTLRTLTEREGKAELARYGITIPRSVVVCSAEVARAAEDIGFPVVLKVVGETLQHKSDVGGVVVNIRSPADADAAASCLAAISERILVEQMIADAVAEILVGITVDPQFGQVLVLGAGGVMTELWQDTITLLPPYTAENIESGLGRLTVWRLLTGFRGKPAGDVPALVQTVLAIARYAAEHVETLSELEVNPILVRPAGRGAVAVDTLIRLVERH